MVTAIKASSVQERFQQVARSRGDAVAIDLGDGTVSYTELNTRANGTAAALQTAGMGPGDVVGLCAGNGCEYVVMLLGALKAGVTPLPLEPETPELRLRSMLATARPTAILVGDDIGDLPGADGVSRLSPADCEPDETDVLAPLHEELPAYLLFTSGSTGEPKAVAGSATGLLRFIEWEIAEFGLGPRSRVSLLAAPTFDVSLRDIFAPLLAGGALCIPETATRARVGALVDWLERTQVTHVHCVPTLFRLITRELEKRPPPALPALERILLAGEPLFATDVAAWRERMDTRVALVNLYGPTETTLAKAFFRIPDDNIPKTENGIMPLGHPIPGARLLIVRDGKACAEGEIGEILIGTPDRSHGYYRAPALTGAAFIANPLGNQGQNDGHRVPDGRSRATGR